MHEDSGLSHARRDDVTGRQFRDLLVGKASCGCEVRVLYDAVGCNKLPRGFFQPLVAGGGKVAAFMPVQLLTLSPMFNFRNHRKLVIADGRAAYTGGINVTDEYLEWQDLGLAICGPGVEQFQEIFVEDWYFTTSEELTAARYFPSSSSDGQETPASESAAAAVCETVASGPDQRFNTMRELFFLAVTQCRSRLWVATPYFVPDSALLLALRSAIYRGVDVRIYLPGRSDSALVRRASRAFYEDLLDSDIAVFEFDGMLHAKAALFDGDLALIGSANLDTRSFRLNFEVGTFVTCERIAGQLSAYFRNVEARSQRVSRLAITRRSYLGQLEDAAAHLLSPLL